jgi:outer membrane protein OmpA-like peptidoglycan-associated protein
MMGLFVLSVAPVMAQEAYDLKVFRGSVPPSTNELIEALTPETRGIKPVEGVKPKAVSLTVRFAFDSSELTEQAVAVLDNLGPALQSQELVDSAFLIEGHTDAVGSAAYNQQLSERRAGAVKQYLVSNHQIPENRLRTVGHGESNLLDPSNPRSGLNRRVQVVNLQ